MSVSQAALKERTKAGGGAARAKAVPARAKAVPARAAVKATAVPAQAKSAVASAPAVAAKPRPSAAQDAASLLSAMGEGGPSRALGALEMCMLDATVDIAPTDHEAYGRFSQTEASMEDGFTLSSDTEKAGPEPEPEPVEEEEEEEAEEALLGEDGAAVRKIQKLLSRTEEDLAKGDFNQAVKALNEAAGEATDRVIDSARAEVEDREAQNLFKVHMEDRFAATESKPAFQSFFQETTKLMEKAMLQGEKFDIFATVVQDTSVEEQRNDVSDYVTFGVDDAGHVMPLCQERTVTDLHWSPRKNDPLLLATYSKRRDAGLHLQDADGLALIWSFMLEDRPEQIFECQSSVMTGLFDQFQPNLVIGGTVSGQIVVWDTRVGETNRYPVQKTPLTAQTHTDPVYSITQVGAKNQEQTLISASTDGRVCHWDLKNLSQPTKYYKLQQTHGSQAASGKQQIYTSDLSVMGMGLPRGQANSFYAASDDCMLYHVQTKDVKNQAKDTRGKSEAEEVPDFTVKPKSSFKGHAGPVTGMSVHPGVSGGAEDDPKWKQIQDQFGDLVLSSSTDWTVHLWNYQSKTASSSTVGLKCFEDPKDYVYDVDWSPEHPALFSCVDGQGILSLYDLTSPDLEMPVVKHKIGDAALNRVKWCPKQGSGGLGEFVGPSYMTGKGHKIATGDSCGIVKVMEVDRRVAVVDPKNVDSTWKTFRENLMEMDDKVRMSYPDPS